MIWYLPVCFNSPHHVQKPNAFPLIWKWFHLLDMFKVNIWNMRGVFVARRVLEVFWWRVFHDNINISLLSQFDLFDEEPRTLPEVTLKAHLRWFIFSWCFLSLGNTIWRCSKWFFLCLILTTRSSTWHSTILPSISLKITHYVLVCSSYIF